MWSSDSGIGVASALHLGLATMRRSIQRWRRNIRGDVGRSGASPNRSEDHSGEIPSRTRHSNSECYSNHAFWTSLQHGSNGLVHCSQDYWPELSHQWSFPIFLPNSDSGPSIHLQHCSISGSGAEREPSTHSNPRKPCSNGLLGDAPHRPTSPPIFLHHLCIFLLIVASPRRNALAAPIPESNDHVM